MNLSRIFVTPTPTFFIEIIRKIFRRSFRQIVSFFVFFNFYRDDPGLVVTSKISRYFSLRLKIQSKLDLNLIGHDVLR